MITNILSLVFLGAIVLVMVSLIPIYLWMMLQAGRKEALLKDQGVTTEAEVVSWDWQKPFIRAPRAPSSSPTAGFITYRFYADTPNQTRQLFTKKENVWVAVHLKYPIGSSIRVRYLPSDPNICQIAESILGLPQDQK